MAINTQPLWLSIPSRGSKKMRTPGDNKAGDMVDIREGARRVQDHWVNSMKVDSEEMGSRELDSRELEGREMGS